MIYVGTGREGHIHRVRSDHSHALFVDVDERQILATQLRGPHPLFVTGDGAAIYDVLPGTAPKREWTSKVLDANNVARFGQVSWRGRGAVSVSARSGNTDKPDATWSEWSKPLTAAGPIASPSARFLQLRVELSAPDSVVYAIEAFYLPQNQPALISEVTVDPPRPKAEKPGSQRAATTSSVYKIKWKTENPDGDSLRYRLFYALEKTANFRPMLRETEIVTGSEQNWETDGVPDGYYRIRVEASDELDNPDPVAQKSHTDSEPVLVDNHPPHFPDLRVQSGRVVGKARDGQGPISKLSSTASTASSGSCWRRTTACSTVRKRRSACRWRSCPRAPTPWSSAPTTPAPTRPRARSPSRFRDSSRIRSRSADRAHIQAVRRDARGFARHGVALARL